MPDTVSTIDDTHDPVADEMLATLDVWAGIRLAARATTSHSGYDRTIRDHVADARRTADPDSRAYWAHKAIALSLLADRGQRWSWGDGSLYRSACQAAARLMGLGAEDR